MPEPSPEEADLRLKVFGLSSSVLTLGTVGLGAILVGFGVALKDTAEAILIALGTGMVAAASYSTLQSYVQNVALLNYLSNGLRSSVAPSLEKAAATGSADAVVATMTTVVQPGVAEVVRDTTREMARVLDEDTPTAAFGPSDKPNPVLNDAIRDQLRRSRSYTFVGVSGTFTAARLHTIDEPPGRSRLNQVRLVLADPRETEALDHRIRQEGKRPETLKETIDDIYCTLVAVALVASRFSELHVHLGIPPLNRHEIFDNTAFTTLFGDEGDAGYRFPRAIQCDRASSWFRTFEKEATYLAKRGEEIALPLGRDDETLAVWLSAVSGSNFAPSDIADLRSRFEAKSQRIRRGESGSLTGAGAQEGTG